MLEQSPCHCISSLHCIGLGLAMPAGRNNMERHAVFSVAGLLVFGLSFLWEIFHYLPFLIRPESTSASCPSESNSSSCFVCLINLCIVETDAFTQDRPTTLANVVEEGNAGTVIDTGKVRRRVTEVYYRTITVLGKSI